MEASEAAGAAHVYMMQLDVDCVIDASDAGNVSRYINHSCDPNCELQRWQVGSEIRIGIFAKRLIPAGEEITYDYKLSAKSAFKCNCGTPSCRGTLKAVSLKEMQQQLERESKERAEAKINAIEEALHKNGRLSAAQRSQLEALADAKLRKLQKLEDRALRDEFLRTCLTSAYLPGYSGQGNLIASGPSEIDFAFLREIALKVNGPEPLVFLPRSARRGANMLQRKTMRQQREQQTLASSVTKSSFPSWWPGQVEAY